MPPASDAAHAALTLRERSTPPGENWYQVSFGPSINIESPAGDQLNDCTELESNRTRGKPRSSTIHKPPGLPAELSVANAIQCRRGRCAPVLKRISWSRSMGLPSMSSASELT